MDLTIIHVDDHMRDLELASLPFSEIDPTITYVPLDEAGLPSVLKALAEDSGVVGLYGYAPTGVAAVPVPTGANR